MNNSVLPIEILEYINENLISDYKYAYLSRSDNIKFSSFLNGTSHIFSCLQTMAYGLRETIISTHIHRKVLSAQEVSEKGGHWEALPLRDGVEIAKELLAALLNYPRVAALVEGLELGVEDTSSSIRLWTQTNALIIQICPNVRYVEVRGFHPPELDTLTYALKQNITCFISHQSSGYRVPRLAASGLQRRSVAQIPGTCEELAETSICTC